MNPFVPTHLPGWVWALYGVIVVLAFVGLGSIILVTMLAREIKKPGSW
jgi:hypothetical protein